MEGAETSRFRVQVPDEEYWRKQIKCQFACPVHTDARGYIRAIAAGAYEHAYMIARGPNPLASICGRVCGAPCEVACRRGSIDQPVSIRALKRFVTDAFGGKPALPSTFLPDQCDGLEEAVHLARYLASREYRRPEGARVAIIGSGPAGLAAAHDLALLGFSPVVFEMESKPAGMLYTGIPAYRLPREMLDAEVELIRALGVEFRCGVAVGRDISFQDLRRQFRAIIIAVGAKRARLLTLPGSDAEGIYGGIDFLRAVALGESIPIGRRVIVVGGGNVAYDVSRSAVRYAAAEEDASRHVDWQTETDISRIAARQPAVREVHLVCLESREEMPADEVEIVEGEEEGIRRHNRLGPKEFLFTGQNGAKRVTGVRFRRVLRVFDENRRFAPVYDDNDTVDLEADTVLLSVGQMADLSFLGGTVTRLALDSETLATDMAGVFAAGDVAYGARLMIDAIASGKKAARSVYRYITGQEVRPEEVQLHFEIEGYRRERGYEGRRRTPIPAATPAERLADPRNLVEKGYTEVQARVEAGRCLDCGVNTIFDGEKCILCGGCVDVCPTLCLKLVGLEHLADSDELKALLEAYGAEPGWSAVIKDEDRCIRCALCAQRCPTHAITMERFQFRQEWCHA